jgi:GntR family transcriptional regulator, transcriptional repressor for pyruvate dehydrogenase complex
MATVVAEQRAQRLAQQVLDVIESEKLRPGDRLLPERQLAEMFDVSRPSLREALHILQAQGHIAIRHGQGTFVQEPQVAQELRAKVMATEHDLRELFDAREALEVPSAYWAAQRRSREDLRTLRATLNRMDLISSRDEIDFDQLAALDAQFHLSIVEAASNRFINQTLGVLQDILQMSMETTLRLPGRMQASRADHAAILDAIERGDADAAGEAARAHIHGACAAALHEIAVKSAT